MLEKLVVPVENREQFSLYNRQGIKNFIVRSRDFSRLGHTSWKAQMELWEDISAGSVSAELEWDILMEEEKFAQVSREMSKLLVQLLKIYPQLTLRVQDLGAAYWLHKNYPQVGLVLNLETGHRNLPSLLYMEQYFASQLKKIILSFELSKDRLELYGENLIVPLEILFHGRIPLFYTPRKLLSPIFPKNSSFLEVDGQSEESPHKGFPIIENDHGTLMFNVKELSLLDVVNELQQFRIDFWRVDLSHFTLDEQERWIQRIKLILIDPAQIREFKQEYPHDLIRGFYGKNRSAILFEKLKNKYLQRDDATFLGEVVEVVKHKHVAVYLERLELSVGDIIQYRTPEGRDIITSIREIKLADGSSVNKSTSALLFLPYTKGVSVRTQLLSTQEDIE